MSTTPLTVEQARQIRYENKLDAEINQIVMQFSEADTVSPQAREKLRGILKHYAKSPHPFRACVRDNMKRFGPGRTEKVCAVLKDIIRGTTSWRHHEDGFAASDADMPVLTDTERDEILAAFSDEDFISMEEAIANAS